MPTYTNGRIPSSLLVVFRTGRNTTDGYWEHAFSPATLARHQALVKLAKKHTGRDLALGDGWSAYRPYEQQIRAKQIHGIYAATPGTSSHGGTFEGQQTLAGDYHNWSWVYEKFGTNKRAAWYADCRAVGLTPGLIEPRRGYPDEPWHVVDENPWVMPSYASTTSTPFPTTTPTTPVPEPEEEDDHMKLKGATYTRATDKAAVHILFNEGSGFYVEHTGVPGAYNNPIATHWETGSWPEISEAHAKVLKAALDRVRTGV